MIINGRPIGPEHQPYIVAEMSGNHNGDINRAFALIEAAKRAGADAVKLQTYTADTITIDHDGPEFLVKHGLWEHRRLFELYQEAHTPWDWHEALFAKGREIGITVFSAPFDPTAVDLLQSLNAPAYKIASFELVDIPLIERAAATGRPLIMSTGMATRTEIGDAVEAARRGGCRDIVLLHCTSAYPASPKEANLVNIPDLAREFGTLAGISDHTMGTEVAVAAVALGAVVVEKHMTLRRADGGVDSAFSLEPEEVAELVRASGAVHAALGRPVDGPKPSELANVAFRRSLYVVEDIAAGEQFTASNIRSIRPSLGLPPKHWNDVIGRKAVRNLRRGEPLAWNMIESGKAADA
jgi:pseudaminic acid synthase